MTLWPPIAPANDIHPRASCSATITKHEAETSAPPYSGGASRPKTPMRLICSINASG